MYKGFAGVGAVSVFQLHAVSFLRSAASCTENSVFIEANRSIKYILKYVLMKEIQYRATNEL